MKYALLQKHFGYSTFRDGQQEIIDAILAGRDALAIMPTGAGKSICYQIPALMLEGITLVISPLISLMKDQVGALRQAGVAAAYLNSSLTPGQYRKAIANAAMGMYKIIYVAPERLQTEEFCAFASRVVISLVAVDEAHCVSQWGQDFRPSYLAVTDFVKSLPVRPVTAAFTATATERVRDDIQAMLQLENPVRLVTGFDRPNLYFEVRHAKEKEKWQQLVQIISEMQGKSGIVYCGTRKRVDEIAEKLMASGIPAARYHAGLSDEERRISQDDFLQDACTVMVATNAFGMGIDKSNVSYVVHYNMPKDPESYYQEAGRAGRDGTPAKCVLLYSGQDVILCNFLLERSSENQELAEAERAFAMEQAKARLTQMAVYATTAGCLRAYLLRYFGEAAPSRCGTCSNCLRGTVERDITDYAATIVAAVVGTGERYGTRAIVGLLTGATEESVASRFASRADYGALQELPAGELSQIIDAMVAADYLSIVPGVYRSLGRGKLSGEVERGCQCIVQMPILEPAQKKKGGKGSRQRADNHAQAGEQVNAALYEHLVRLRLQIAKRQGVPAFMVFSNATLEDMCRNMPRSMAEMRAVSGVGDVKLAAYGEEFLRAVVEFA